MKLVGAKTPEELLQIKDQHTPETFKDLIDEMVADDPKKIMTLYGTNKPMNELMDIMKGLGLSDKEVMKEVTAYFEEKGMPLPDNIDKSSLSAFKNGVKEFKANGLKDIQANGKKLDADTKDVKAEFKSFLNEDPSNMNLEDMKIQVGKLMADDAISDKLFYKSDSLYDKLIQ